MPNQFVIWPSAEEAAARAYMDAANAWFSANLEPGGLFCNIRNDRLGDWVVQYLGPPYEYPLGTVVQEPPEMVPLRALGEVSPSYEWPDEQ